MRRLLGDQRAQRVVRHLQIDRPGQCLNSPAGDGRGDRMEIAHVAGNMQRGELPLAIGQLVEARGEAVDHQAGVVHFLAGTNEVALRPDFGELAGQRQILA